MRGGERIGGGEAEKAELTAEERVEKQRRLGVVALEGMEPEEDVAERTIEGDSAPTEGIVGERASEDVAERVGEDKFAPLREQWGVMTEGKNGMALELEQGISWGEFQTRAEELWQAGQESDDAVDAKEAAWIKEADDKLGDVGWALTWRLKDYNMLKTFGDIEAKGRCFYGDVDTEMATLALFDDEIRAKNYMLTESETDGFQANRGLLHLSYDEFDEDGGRISGLKAERPTDENKKITMVFNNDITMGYDFAMMAKYPTLGGVEKLRQSLLAMVAKNEAEYGEMSEVAERQGIPLFTEQEWLEGGEELLQKVTAEHATKVKEYYDRKAKERQQRAEERLEHNRRLKSEVFDKVDNEAVNELVHQYVEKIDRSVLLKIREVMREDKKTAAVLMAGYMTEILGLKYMPEIFYVDNLGNTTRGVCIELPQGGDLIGINDRLVNQYNVNEFIGTMAHECWHSYQHDVKNDTDGTVHREQQERYAYNLSNYIEVNKDYEGYYKQLVEVEARAFGAAVREKLVGEEEKERLEREVFQNVDRAEARRVVEDALSGVDVEDMLRRTGKRDVRELLNGAADEVIVNLVGYLNQVLGQTEPLRINILETGDQIKMNSHEAMLEIGGDAAKESMNADTLRSVLKLIWLNNRQDFLKKKPYDKRGELYNYNIENYKFVDTEGSDEQLLDVEMNEFVKVFAEKVTKRPKQGLMGRIRERFRRKK